MEENNLFKNDKENYIYNLRLNLLNLHIEQKMILKKNIGILNKKSKEVLQDQFRKLRSHFDTIEY